MRWTAPSPTRVAPGLTRLCSLGNHPSIGDYLVFYGGPDGYISMSPKGVFESGYSLVREHVPFAEETYELPGAWTATRRKLGESEQEP